MGQTGQSEAIHYSRGMGQNRAEPDDAGGLIDGGGLHGRDLMLA
jgi:hypothetical protein